MSTKPRPLVENDKAHFDVLTALGQGQQWGVKYLYDRLNILDSKTSALLRFNGVALGFLAVLSLRIVETRMALNPNPGIYLTVCCLIFVLLSYAEYQAFCIFSLRFDRVTADRTFEQYKQAFFEITCSREQRYGRALVASALGGALFVLLILALILQSDLVWEPGTPLEYLTGRRGA